MAAPKPPDPLVALRGRRVVLGVTGGIAAYKAAEVCRRLVDAGAHVVPVLTSDAQRFIGALTFSALASEPARTSLFDGPDPIPPQQPTPTRTTPRARGTSGPTGPPPPPTPPAAPRAAAP